MFGSGKISDLHIICFRFKSLLEGEVWTAGARTKRPTAPTALGRLERSVCIMGAKWFRWGPRGDQRREKWLQVMRNYNRQRLEKQQNIAVYDKR